MKGFKGRNEEIGLNETNEQKLNLTTTTSVEKCVVYCINETCPQSSVGFYGEACKSNCTEICLNTSSDQEIRACEKDCLNGECGLTCSQSIGGE
jgi:hypothetical protein